MSASLVVFSSWTFVHQLLYCLSHSNVCHPKSTILYCKDSVFRKGKYAVWIFFNWKKNFFFWERASKWGKERDMDIETSLWERNIDQFTACTCPDQESNPTPFGVCGYAPSSRAWPARAVCVFPIYTLITEEEPSKRPLKFSYWTRKNEVEQEMFSIVEAYNKEVEGSGISTKLLLLRKVHMT